MFKEQRSLRGTAALHVFKTHLFVLIWKKELSDLLDWFSDTALKLSTQTISNTLRTGSYMYGN